MLFSLCSHSASRGEGVGAGRSEYGGSIYGDIERVSELVGEDDEVEEEVVVVICEGMALSGAR